MNKEILAYVAGFLDAEGGFSIRKYRDKNQKQNYGIYIGFRVSNTNKEILEYLSKLFGGSVGEHKLNKNVGKWKKAYRWQISARKAYNLLIQIYPYLRIKKPQADLMLKFRKTLTNSTRAISKELWKKRFALKKQMNILNKRGL